MIRQIWAPLCCSVLLGNVAVAQESPSQLFTLHVKAQPLRFAVRELGEQAGVQVMMRLSGRAADDIEVAAIDGRLTVQEALERMLANTGLTYEFVNASTIRILEATPSKAEGGTSSTESSAERDGIVDVLVMGKKPFTDENVDIVRTVNDVQPYRILNSQAIEQSGATNVEQFLKHNLTMNTVSLSNAQQTPNAFGNMSSINLRGLGANHTLILINGRRTAAINAVGSTGQPDVNGIPTAAIDRIEVLPSSAAAIYGGAAVGGVVNIVLKHEYTGAEIKVTQDNTFDTNAP
ncbi:TonB-dependent receptor, partial [Steroidobacter sp.]|uniref:TonB-dependent receptor n=1 Tax=Steroidobacter sp. TaxID=1978227 RepID=UPI001A4BB96C